MAKPDTAGEGKDKLQKPSDSQQKSSPFSGEKHPLTDKDAQKILQKHDANPVEQFFQTAQKVTKAAQDAIGVAVDTTKQVTHDVSETIRTGGDVGKQLEKSSDTIVAKALTETGKIEKALGKSNDEISSERKVANSLYELKKHDAKEAAKAVSAFVDGSDKSQKQVIEAATHSGDVTKAMESHGNQIIDRLLQAKAKVDVLLGKDPYQSQKENFVISAGYGIDKSLVKGVTGLVSMLDRPQDKDVQLLNRFAPISGATLALTRNLADATGHIWNAGGKYIDHVNRIGIQAAGEETWKSTQNWMMHAKPYDWSEKATDTAMLVTGGIGLAKTGLSVLGKIKMAQAVVATETVATGTSIAAGETAIVDAGAAKAGASVAADVNTAKAGASVSDSAAAKAEASVAGDSAAAIHERPGAVKPEEQIAKPTEAKDAPKAEVKAEGGFSQKAEQAAADLANKVFDSKEPIQTEFRNLLHESDKMIEEAIGDLKSKPVESLTKKQKSQLNVLEKEWSSFKQCLTKLKDDHLGFDEFQSELSKARNSAKKLDSINDSLGGKKLPLNKQVMEKIEAATNSLKVQIEAITGQDMKLLNAYRAAVDAAAEGAQPGAIEGEILSNLKGSPKPSSELLTLRQMCRDLHPEHAGAIEHVIDQVIARRQIDLPGATKLRGPELIGVNEGNIGETFINSARQNSVFESMSKESQSVAETFLNETASNKSYSYKVDKLPGYDHFLVTVVDVADNNGAIKMYQQEIKAGQDVFGVRHILATKHPSGVIEELPYLKVIDIKSEGKAGIAGVEGGGEADPHLIGKLQKVDKKNKYQIFGNKTPVNFKFAPDSFFQHVHQYRDYLEELLSSASFPK